jgi:hypothetical protein
MPKSKDKVAIAEVITDEQWLFLTRKPKDSSNTKAAFGYDII